jgi:2-oxo-hept-3-ene-1,7-dioate hydratase
VSPRAEPELAILIGRDVSSGATEADIRESIVGFAAAIELVDVDSPAVDPEFVLAGNIYHRAVIIGPTRPPSDIANLGLRMIRNGAVTEVEGVVTEALEAAPTTARLVASTLEAFGARLRSGETIIAGTLIRPLEISAGERLDVRLADLDSIAVQF